MRNILRRKTSNRGNREYLLTSESVSEGHPDKIADQISDAVLDVFLANDFRARVACETFVTKGLVIVGGEVTASCHPSIPDVVRWTINNIGYTGPSYGFDYRSCHIITRIHPQSTDIAEGVFTPDREFGAGDQGTMVGYATSETPELMPLGISLAHKLVQKQAELRRNGAIAWLRPDAKSQVTVRYVGAKPVSVEKVVLSTQHSPDVSHEEIEKTVISEIIEKVIPEELRARNIQYLVNPAGRFVIGGPEADTGLTGRKIIVDTYGPACPHGGGAFSGKDPTKVDRSGAYMARYIAKNIVAAGLAERCTVQLAYAIGQAQPLALSIDLHGTGKVDEQKLTEAVSQIFQLTPQGIIQMLALDYPIYRRTAAYGHFGRELPEFTWEMTDQVGKLRSYFGIPQDAPSPVETDTQRRRRIFARIASHIESSGELWQFETRSSDGTRDSLREEYEVYKCLIESMIADEERAGKKRVGLIVLAGRTRTEHDSYGGRDLKAQFGGELEESTIADFIKRNNRPCHLIASRLRLFRHHLVLTDKEEKESELCGARYEFYLQHPDPSSVLRFSRVGFNNKFDQAMVYVEWGGPLCGRGYYIFLNKDGDGKWTEQGETLAWLS